MPRRGASVILYIVSKLLSRPVRERNRSGAGFIARLRNRLKGSGKIYEQQLPLLTPIKPSSVLEEKSDGKSLTLSDLPEGVAEVLERIGRQNIMNIQKSIAEVK